MKDGILNLSQSQFAQIVLPHVDLNAYLEIIINCNKKQFDSDFININGNDKDNKMLDSDSTWVTSQVAYELHPVYTVLESFGKKYLGKRYVTFEQKHGIYVNFIDNGSNRWWRKLAQGATGKNKLNKAELKSFLNEHGGFSDKYQNVYLNGKHKHSKLRYVNNTNDCYLNLNELLEPIKLGYLSDDENGQPTFIPEKHIHKCPKGQGSSSKQSKQNKHTKQTSKTSSRKPQTCRKATPSESKSLSINNDDDSDESDSDDGKKRKITKSNDDNIKSNSETDSDESDSDIDKSLKPSKNDNSSTSSDSNNDNASDASSAEDNQTGDESDNDNDNDNTNSGVSDPENIDSITDVTYEPDTISENKHNNNKSKKRIKWDSDHEDNNNNNNNNQNDMEIDSDNENDKQQEDRSSDAPPRKKRRLNSKVKFYAQGLFNRILFLMFVWMYTRWI